ncbi:Fe-S cluster biogenesis protein NfuA, 4Fe-4S-binding domain [Micromonospora viridifaciens]|uniref:Fe-S cluster biogenesis protein NfuA, 4Fe-4S-binding domain n=1 Tax=Micromonospora viridifaciens TaxID=1881 RepID=A0A1C4XGG8_MICVI|nr:NifU family protein [Micromonospora viridifaciens]SCF07281.1 Fe-S cluster biogenesis protein NfuA, 4Fe-4S-binding domain [Micromonospora viridifaciens]
MAEQPDVPRLDDAAVEPRLARLDAVLGQLEQTPGRTAELALEAVELLTAVYGEALARVTDLATDSPGARDRLTGDELLRHLLLLHRIHPDPVQARVTRAVDDLRPQVRAQGGEIALVGVEDGVARISLSATSCGASALRDLVREQVLTFAPELSAVDVVAPAPAPALIPVATLWRRPDAIPADRAAAGDGVPQAAGPLALGGPA